MNDRRTSYVLAAMQLRAARGLRASYQFWNEIHRTLHSGSN